MPSVSSGSFLGPKTFGNIKVYGVQDMIAKLKLVGSRAGLEVGNLTYRAAGEMYRAAVTYVPTITTNLQTGIKGPVKVGKYDWIVTVASMDGTDPKGKNKNQKEYAHFVEFGTSKMTGRYFMAAAAADAEAFIRINMPFIAQRIQRL